MGVGEEQTLFLTRGGVLRASIRGRNVREICIPRGERASEGTGDEGLASGDAHLMATGAEKEGEVALVRHGWQGDAVGGSMVVGEESVRFRTQGRALRPLLRRKNIAEGSNPESLKMSCATALR